MKQIGNILIIVIIIVVLALGAIYYLKSKSPTVPSTTYTKPSTTSQPVSTKSAEQTKTYKSKTLKLSISVPSVFNIKDEEIRILISNQAGIIIVSRNGTQFSSLDEYIKDFDLKHKTQVSNEKRESIDGYPALSRIIKYPGSIATGDKIYFIYVSDAVYHISTSSESLYDTLDQIAQSFRYIP